MALRTRLLQLSRQDHCLGALNANRKVFPLDEVRRRVIMYWLLISTILTVTIVAASTALTHTGVRQDGDGVRFNLLIFGIALIANMFGGRLWPMWWRRVLLTSSILPLPLLSYTSGNLPTLISVTALLLPMIWLGREIAQKLAPSIDSAECWIIGSALGVGLVALLGFILGALGYLRPGFIWVTLAGITGILIIRARGNLGRDLKQVGHWLKGPITARPMTLLLIAMMLSCVWLNLIGALAPEVRSDAIRQRLATAVHFTKIGSIRPTDPDLVVADAPALGEITYAVGTTIGPVQTAKLIHWLVGIFCAAAIFGLGRRLHSTQAGGIAAFIFYSTLLVGFLSQTAYLDLFTVLFAVVAALCLTIGVGNKQHIVACAGVLTGFGVAVKLHFGYIAIGLAITAIGIALRAGKRQAVQTTIVFTLFAVLAATPWFIRSVILTGSVPGLQLGANSLIDTNSKSKGDLVDFGFGRSLFQFVISPFTATFLSGKYGGTQIISGVIGGHGGFLAFGCVPLLIAIRRERFVLSVMAGTVTAAVLWFYTAQYLRYGLPIFALFSTVAGVVYVTIRENTTSKRDRIILDVLLCIMALSGMFIRLQLPDTAHRFTFGLQSRDAYLTEWMGGQAAGTYTITQMLNAEPTATRVLASYDGARLYSNVRISQPWSTGGDLIFEGSEEQVWARIGQDGYSHILLDRSPWQGDKWYWDQMTIIDEDFLRCNTALVGGGDYSYLYRLLPPDQRGCKQAWAQGRERIGNGDFTLIEQGLPQGWELVGDAPVPANTPRSQGNPSALLLTAQQTVQTQVAITPGTQYLLAEATRTVEGYGRIAITVKWHDANGNLLGTAGEEMPVSPRKYHTFSMLATAPDGATTATICAQVLSGEVWFDNFSLRSVTPDQASRTATK